MRKTKRAPRTLRLAPRLVPEPLFYKNLRRHLKQYRWQKLIATPVKEAAKWRCEICRSCGVDRRGGKKSGNGSPMNWDVCCDEDWLYEDQTQTATLVGLQCICWKCNLVIHAGFAEAVSTLEQLAEYERHAVSVNKMTISNWKRVVANEWDVWERRSKLEWTICWDRWEDILHEKCAALQAQQ